MDGEHGGEHPDTLCSGHLPPATSSGPFFFFSSCTASMNSFPPFFSRALPANRGLEWLHPHTTLTDSRIEERWRPCRQTDKQADMEMDRQVGQHADNDAVNHSTWLLSWVSELCCAARRVSLTVKLWKSLRHEVQSFKVSVFQMTHPESAKMCPGEKHFPLSTLTGLFDWEYFVLL